MKKLASVISTLFSPLLVPTYGVGIALLTTILYYVDLGAKLHVLLTTLATTAVLPTIAIYILTRMGRVSDADIPQRRERTIPYVIALICYLGCAIYMATVNAPLWLTMFVAGGALALTAVTIINLWWKVSAHATAMGGLIGLMMYIIARGLNVWSVDWLAMAVILLAGLVGTSRLILDRHNLWQIAAGYAIGFLAVFFCADINFL
jgi:membrane-associated phospholipid phosphatase